MPWQSDLKNKLVQTMHKSGFVNIIGNPNVGKSTLMNALVGERLSIITSKAQTTRHRIMGIVNGDDFQIVYSDTPGILKPAYKLQESMMNFVHGAVDDADVILYVTDTVEQSDRSENIVERVNRSGIPAIVVINKIDPLRGLDKIKLCVAYEKDGKIVNDFPADLDELAKCTPVYEEFEGFTEDISGVRKYEDFPESIKTYIEAVEKACGCPVSIIGVGPDREQIVYKD